MKKRIIEYRFFVVATASVWVINGLFCKLLDLVPRHQRIISRLFGAGNAEFLTNLIGISEVLMAVWIFSGLKTRLNAIVQIILVLAMNIIEVSSVPQMLLFGRYNMVLALAFCGVVYYTEFVLNKRLSSQI